MKGQGKLFSSKPAPLFQPVESVRKAIGADLNNIKPMTTQERYRMYQSYSKDKARVDAGGAPRARTVRSYDALRPAISQQFDALTSAPGVPKVNFGTFTGSDNYADAGAMAADMRKGNLNINRTQPGEETVAWDNPTNDKFRVVHDMVAHGAGAASFSPEGESMATRAHMATLPQATHAAIMAEVAGQATHWEFNNHQFVDQKGLYSAPRWAVQGTEPPRPPRRSFVSRAKQGRLFL